jgi:hypothetical protein
VIAVAAVQASIATFDPCRHWDGADAAVLADQIYDAPAAVALLDVRERERRHLGATEPAAEKYRDNRAVPQAVAS